MNSGHSHYISLDEPRKTRWLPLAFVAIAASVGVLIGSGISKASAETALYTATSVRGIPIVQAQPSYLTQARNVHVASAVETSDEKFPEQTQFVEENVSTSNASWTSMALIPLAAAAGFFLGSRKVVKKSVSDETFEVVIDDGEEEIAMAATTGMLGHKVGMTRIPDENGSLTPVTVIRLGPCVVTQVKTSATDGYDAVQLGYHETKERKLTQPEKGHLAKSGAPPLKHLREYHVPDPSQFTPGQVLLADIFKEGELVDVQGEVIGKGFQGTIRLWNFARGRKTHGSKSYREPGSTGPGTTPGRVYPSSKGAGRWGGRTTIRKLKVMGVDTEQHLLLVKGSIPGPEGNLVSVKSTV